MEQPKVTTCLAWINCLQRNRSPVDTLNKRNIEEIIVYGVADLGELFINEAITKNFEIIGITDQKIKVGNYAYRGINVLPRNELGLPKYRDKCVVVTSMTSFEQIKQQLMKENVNNVISLWELLDEAIK